MRLPPRLLELYLGPELRDARRRLRRMARRGAPKIVFHHQVDDPHSYLLAQALRRVDWPFAIVVAVVPRPDADAEPEPDLAPSWALADCHELARHYRVDAPPGPAALGLTPRAAAAVLARPTIEEAVRASAALFAGDESALPSEGPDPQILAENARALRAGGHYRGGVIEMEGEWYLGLERLPYLTARLEAEGIATPALDLRRPSPIAPPPRDDEGTLEMWFSFRSPYAYLALDRIAELAARYPIALRVRPVLPMVTRGLPVPKVKRMYLVRDAAREAARLGVPFGRISDPLGEGVERCLAIWPRAEASGRGLEVLRSIGRGIWAEGRDPVHHLPALVERAGLSWAEISRPIDDGPAGDWRAAAEANGQALRAIGLWGVPSFRLGSFVTWGQDRLPMIEDRLRAPRP